jgi:hypothetical protein
MPAGIFLLFFVVPAFRYLLITGLLIAQLGKDRGDEVGRYYNPAKEMQRSSALLSMGGVIER